MWLLDTVTLSEAMKPHAHKSVLTWLAAQDPSALHTSTICIGELRYGVERLPPGVRRNDLRRWLDRDVIGYFESRLVSFDLLAAQTWAEMRVQLRQTPPIVDSMIAACALSRGFVVVTRNSSDFEALGVPVFNPWQSD